ncbi:MAG: hypothetical protein UDM07_05350, partial [Adlercreutzia sp.]|nr:hypothetical protein [Adlercreutzia sp.]
MWQLGTAQVGDAIEAAPEDADLNFPCEQLDERPDSPWCGHGKQVQAICKPKTAIGSCPQPWITTSKRGLRIGIKPAALGT